MKNKLINRFNIINLLFTMEALPNNYSTSQLNKYNHIIDFILGNPIYKRTTVNPTKQIHTKKQFKEYILSHKELLNMRNLVGDTALIIAIRDSNRKDIMKIIKNLLDAGCNTNLVNDYGSTALTYAIRQRRNDTVKLLIKAGCDVNWINSDKNSVLMLSCNEFLTYETSNIISMLLSAGANITYKNKLDNTALITLLSQLCNRYSVSDKELIKLLHQFQINDTDIKNYLERIVNAIISLGYKNSYSFGKLFKLLLSLSSTTNEDILMYMLNHTDPTFMDRFYRMILDSPLNLSLVIKGRTCFEWVCIECNCSMYKDIVEYCFEKNKYTENDLLRCIKIGNHKELLINLLIDLLFKKTVYFNLYLYIKN